MLGPCLLDDLLRPENADYESRDLVFGHLGVALVALASETFTVLREPHAHVRSWYEHVRREQGHYFHSTVTREEVSFLDWLTDPRFACLARNPQARYLGMPFRVPAGQFDPAAPWHYQRAYETAQITMSDTKLLSEAHETLESCSLVGTTDDLKQFISSISDKFGFPVPASVPRLNTASASPLSRPTNEEIAALERCTELDSLLYREARRRSRPRVTRRLLARMRW